MCVLFSTHRHYKPFVTNAAHATMCASSTEVRCRVRHTSINTGFAAIARCALQPAATLSSSEIKYAICVIQNYLLSLSRRKLPEWWNGRHEGLKIPWPLRLCGFESHFRYPRGRISATPLFCACILLSIDVVRDATRDELQQVPKSSSVSLPQNRPRLRGLPKCDGVSSGVTV